MDAIKKLEEEKFENIAKMLDKLPDTFENTYDKGSVWYDKKNHISDLDFSIIHIIQTEKAIENIEILDKKLANEVRSRNKFVLEQKYEIETLWAKEYENRYGADKFLKNWNKDLVKNFWDKKFKECLWHLALVCQYNKKYCKKDAKRKIVFISSDYPHKWLLDWNERMYEKEMIRDKKKISCK